MHLREATADDARPIRRVARASWHAAYDDIIGPEAVDTVVEDWYDVEELTESIERSQATTLVAETDSEVVGFAQGAPTDEGPADAIIPRIYVIPDRWGNGIGSALLDRLTAALCDAGCDDVWLVVLEANEVGRTFYDAHGFDIVDRRTDELAGEPVDELVLVASL